MAPAPTSPRPVAELVEEAALRLTSAQLHALASRVAADELRDPEPEPRPDFATALRFDLHGTIRHAVALWVDGIGVDPDIFSAWYLPGLIRAGVPESEALAALHRVCGWRPRSDEERWAAVARGMLDDGFPADVVRRAIATAADRELEEAA